MILFGAITTTPRCGSFFAPLYFIVRRCAVISFAVCLALGATAALLAALAAKAQDASDIYLTYPVLGLASVFNSYLLAAQFLMIPLLIASGVFWLIVGREVPGAWAPR